MDPYDPDSPTATQGYKIPSEWASKADSCGLKLYTFSEVREMGKNKLADFKVKPPSKDDCLMFSYTSGTTGDPKGVKLTHQMITQTACAVNMKLGSELLGEKDCYISYLPAAHSFEQGLFGCVMVYGMKCGFYGGDPL